MFVGFFSGEGKGQIREHLAPASPPRDYVPDFNQLNLDRFHDGLANMAHVGATLSRFERRMAAVRSRYRQVVLLAGKVSVRPWLSCSHAAVR